MAMQWSEHVNKDFYKLSISVKNNVQKIEFESGHTRTWLKNTRSRREISVSLDIWSDGELKAFFDWYNNTIACGAKSFYLQDFITHDAEREYMLVDAPTVSGQKPKEVSLKFIEV